jgi:hypothetical protein
MKKDIKIMGIVNLTDNSYFATSRCLSKDGEPDIEKTLARVGRMIEDGADIIDIGACSTGPGTEAVGEKEEWRRLEPALKAIRSSFPNIPISIDTYWASVVWKCHGLIGDFIVNDVTAGERDGAMLPTVGEIGLPYIAMHMRGTSKTMQSLTDYPAGVVSAVHDYFSRFEERAERNGVRDWILDPGFGFAKTIDQNYELMGGLDKFADFGKQILVGISRKSMIYRLFNITPEEALPATQALHIAALQKGASILRVHDVAETARTIEIFNRIFCKFEDLKQK